MKLFQFYDSAIKSSFVRRRRNRRTCFNSTIVRLKGNVRTRADRGNLLWFQFYDSAIKSMRSQYDVTVLWHSFNSTIVRLKGSKAGVMATSSPVCFNSTIVRLKGYFAIARLFCHPLFQFYDSAIKSMLVGCTFDLPI